MALRKTTIEEFDNAGKLKRRTVTEEDDQQPLFIRPYIVPNPMVPDYAPAFTPNFPNYTITCVGDDALRAQGGHTAFLSGNGNIQTANGLVDVLRIQ